MEILVARLLSNFAICNVGSLLEIDMSCRNQFFPEHGFSLFNGLIGSWANLRMRRKARATVLMFLVGGMTSGNAWSQLKAPMMTHCAANERVLFSCPFKHGKTVSLCASADLSSTDGTLQYRYGVIGRAPELMFPILAEGAGASNHPKNWFRWSYFDRTSLGGKKTSLGAGRWPTKDVPAGVSVAISMVFTPIEDHPEINFVIEAMAGPESRYQGSVLTIFESVGAQGHTLAEHKCIKEKTVEDLFSLRDIIRR